MPTFQTCPHCGASVRAENLPAHVSRMHRRFLSGGRTGRGVESPSKGHAPSRLPISPRALLAVAAASLLVVLVGVAALTLTSPRTPSGDATEGPSYAGEVEVYLQPTCGCCHEYMEYLRGQGFEVTPHEVEDLVPIKDGLGIPANMQSCHTALIDGYVVEGHVPVAALQALLRDRPALDGIALPGMPSGSPGMGGTQVDDFVIYALDDGQTSVFLVL